MLAAYDRGRKTQEIADAFGLSEARARRVKRRGREHGELAPRPRVGKHPIKINRARLAELRDRRGSTARVRRSGHVSQRRAEWLFRRAGIHPHRLIFIEETWAKTEMTQLVAKVPHGHWLTTMLVAPLDISGVRCSMQIEGAIDAASFEPFVKHVLAPKFTPGDTGPIRTTCIHTQSAMKATPP